VTESRFRISLLFLAVLGLGLWFWQGNHNRWQVVECVRLQVCVVFDARNQEVWVVGAGVPGLHTDPQFVADRVR
jgi:hypothetical protein